MALDDFQMPSFKDPDGTMYVWDSASKSYVKTPLTDNRPDQSHATGGDNDLFDPFQHTETGGNPSMEGYMARTAKRGDPCPNCGQELGVPNGQPSWLSPDKKDRSQDVCDSCGWQGPWVVRAKTQYGHECGDCGTHFDPYANDYTCPQCGHLIELDKSHKEPSIEDFSPEYDESFPELIGQAPRQGSIDDPPFPAQNEVKCPNCGETTPEHVCPTCQKDLTPEWNTHGQQNEFFDAKPDFNDANEFWTWPQNVPKKNEVNYDDSFPSMSLSKVAGEDTWDGIFGDSVPMRTEVGRWIATVDGQLHIGHGTNELHEQIEARDGITPELRVALGSVYNDGSADVQKVFQADRFNFDQVQEQLQQVFGQIQLQSPIGEHSQKSDVFPVFDLQGGQWFFPPYTDVVTGSVWVKERSEGTQYQPNMVLCAEHLQPEDLGLWVNGCAGIITAVGGASSHAAYLAMTENVPVVVGIGDGYNKLETGNYVKIDPRTEVITVMPGATGETQPEQKQQIWNNILEYQRQRGGSVSKPVFSHFFEELAWKEANDANLEECPECSAPMVDQDDKSVCHDCGHKQPIIVQGGAAAIPIAAEALGGGEAAGAAGASGGVSGIGGLMQKAMRPGFSTGLMMGEHGGGQDAGAPTPSAPPVESDPTVGVVSRRHAAWNHHHAGPLSAIFEALLNAAKSGSQAAAGALGKVDWSQATRLVNPLDPVSPLSYIDDAAMGGLSAAQEQISNQVQQTTSSLGDDDDDDSVGLATKNDGTNSTEDASDSGIEGKKEQGDGPEQLKDVDGGHDSQDSAAGDNLQGDPHLQDKALKAFHMNLPLVIEFADSDEPGADNPILLALDQLLEEAFPGYKDGQDPAGETTEHPLESEAEDSDPDVDIDKPDEKSEGADKKKESAALASVWHYAEWDPNTGYASDHPYSEYEEPLENPACPMCGGEGVPLGSLGRRSHYRCRNCGWDFSDTDSTPTPTPPTEAPPSGGGQEWLGKTSGQFPLETTPVPTGTGGLGIQICPRCGQAHPAGTPCPVADVTAPLTTGAPIGPGAPTNAIVTKWHLAMPSNLPASQPQVNMGAPGGTGTTCSMCGCNHIPGTPCPSYNQQPPQQTPMPAATGVPVAPAPMPGVSYSSLFDHNHEDEDGDSSEEEAHGDYHSDNDWVDETGTPLEEGAEYELKTAASPIPDRVTIERILPEKLTYIIHSGDVDFRDTITRDQLDLDGATFSAVDFDDTGEDSMDQFSDEEMPPRPGDDALPQQDDLSTPSTVVSNTESFERVSLETYTGSFQNDIPDDRSWLLANNSEVEVDPALMSKLAGKDFSAREQREFIDENGEARNLDRLDLSGTHYVDDLGINDSLW